MSKKKQSGISEELTLPSGIPEDYAETPHAGLTEAEAAARIAAGESNRATADPGKSLGKIVADNLFTLFNLLNVLLAAALAYVAIFHNPSAWKDIAFMGVVFGNTACATHQELKAKHMVRKLKLMSESPVKVRREGAERQVPLGECVRGDLVLLRAGDQVPADAILREGSCTVSESLLTGEADAVPKNAGDWLYSGSFLTAGTCAVQLVYVGDRSYVSRLSHAAKKITPPQSALMGDMHKIVRAVSVMLLPMGILLFCKRFFFAGQPIDESIRQTVTSMVGMIPEGLMLLTSLALTVGVVRLGQRKTLVQQIYGIENLARVDVLCLDKTGTITSGRMALMDTLPVDADREELTAAISRFLGAVDRESPTMQALCAAFPPGAEQAETLLSFSSERKKSAAGFADGTVLTVGAPSFVLDGRQLDRVRDTVNRAAKDALRVLVLAEGHGTIRDGELPPVEQILGLFMISDEVRPEAPETLRYFRHEGVTVKVISGDDPATVAAIAEQAGIPDARQNAVDVSLLTEEELRQEATRATVFGRVTPDRKKMLVEALQAAGHSVAMTGDGVNDIPAMKASDCSIAMASGSDAARHASQVILLDSNFACLPRVVAEGRRVINNITRSASLFLVKTMYSAALALLALLLPIENPFETHQLSLISTLMVGIPSFLLTLEPDERRLQGNFIWGVLRRAIPGAAAVTVCGLTASLLHYFAPDAWPMDVCRTIAVLSDGAVCVFMLISVCIPLNRLRKGLIIADACAFAAASALLRNFFELKFDQFGRAQYLVLGGLILLGAVMVAGIRLWLEARNSRRMLLETAERQRTRTP